MIESKRGEAEVIISDRAVVHIVKNHVMCRHEDLAAAIPHDPDHPPLTGSISCPRGCGTSIQWAVAADLIGYKEDLLIFLYQQLNWTACPDHDVILPQVSLPEKEVSATTHARHHKGPRRTRPAEGLHSNRYE